MSPSLSEPPPVDQAHPWPGLVAFTETAREFFFGREREEEELLRRIENEMTTVLFGQSGLGKTSLLQAGLAPQLRAQCYVPVLVRLSYDEDANSPAEQFHNLFAQAMAEAAPSAPPLGAQQTIWEYLHRRDPPHEADQGATPVPVFLIDQFEEAFTLGLSREKARPGTQQFLTELADLIENRCPAAVRERLERDTDEIEQFSFGRGHYRIVIVLREDYLPHLDALQSRAPSLGRNRFRLIRMDGSQALNAVLQPGVGLIEPDVAEEIVRLVAQPRPDDPFGSIGEGNRPALAGLEVEPPLLSLFCRELNERRIEAGLDRITENILTLNRDSILETFYERAFKGLPERLRDFVENELVTDSGLRESIAVERAQKMLGRKPAMRTALEELVRRRLLHVEERFEMPRIELIHDLLAEVAVRSRARRRRRQNIKRWGAAAAALAIILIGMFVVSALMVEQARQAGRNRAQQWLTFALACSTQVDNLSCLRLESIDDGTLHSMSDEEASGLLLSLRLVAESRYSSGNVAGGFQLINKAAILLEGRQGFDLDFATTLATKAQMERWLNLNDAAMRDNQRAGALLQQLLPTLRAAGPDEAGRLDEALSTSGTVNYELAFLDRAHKDGYLSEALERENERVRLAQQHVNEAPGDVEATRRLMYALGSRSWGNVLANNPRAAIVDADRAFAIDSNQHWLRGNKGDALLLQGQVDAAMRVFADIQGESGIAPRLKLCDNILDDLNWLERLQIGSADAIARVRRGLNCAAPNAGR